MILFIWASCLHAFSFKKKIASVIPFSHQLITFTMILVKHENYLRKKKKIKEYHLSLCLSVYLFFTNVVQRTNAYRCRDSVNFIASWFFFFFRMFIRSSNKIYLFYFFLLQWIILNKFSLDFQVQWHHTTHPNDICQ